MGGVMHKIVSMVYPLSNISVALLHTKNCKIQSGRGQVNGATVSDIPVTVLIILHGKDTIPTICNISPVEENKWTNSGTELKLVALKWDR